MCFPPPSGCWFWGLYSKDSRSGKRATDVIDRCKSPPLPGNRHSRCPQRPSWCHIATDLISHRSEDIPLNKIFFLGRNLWGCPLSSKSMSVEQQGHQDGSILDFVLDFGLEWSWEMPLGHHLNLLSCIPWLYLTSDGWLSGMRLPGPIERGLRRDLSKYICRRAHFPTIPVLLKEVSPNFYSFCQGASLSYLPPTVSFISNLKYYLWLSVGLWQVSGEATSLNPLFLNIYKMCSTQKYFKFCSIELEDSSWQVRDI